jgi:hypothetical protein
MPARTEPPLAARSRIGSTCAKWLRLSALVLGASSLAVACFLNPKTDDLPGSNVAGPGVDLNPGGGDYGSDPDDGEQLVPGATGAPSDLGEPPANAAEPDAGAASDTLGADAGADLAHDSGLDAD